MFASGLLSHAFAIKKPKKQNPEKNPKPENITEEIREKEAEKIVLKLKKFSLFALSTKYNLSVNTNFTLLLT